jgi:predicted ATP-dependent endonuclease of OLD family
MRIESLSVENLTLFGKNQLKFSDGLNIIVGENDTGKKSSTPIIIFFN